LRFDERNACEVQVLAVGGLAWRASYLPVVPGSLQLCSKYVNVC